MTEDIINICGKDVHLAYCFATEIAFKDLTGEDITDFMIEVGANVNKEQPHMPDIRKTIFAIIAAAIAYSQAKGVDAEISDKDIMNNASPRELAEALGMVALLRSQFYYIPAGEPDGKKDDRGNQKND